MKRRVASRRNAFSLVELLVALAISAALLTAALGALDASWKGYKTTTESASTHVVSRIVVHRLLAMIRTGTEFGPYPADFFDPTQNPVSTTSIEFQEATTDPDEITRIEQREAADGTFDLYYMRIDTSGASPVTVVEYPLITGVLQALFLMEYEPGPRLVRATIDLTIEPNDDADMNIGAEGDTPVIRLVASAVPRQLQ